MSVPTSLDDAQPSGPAPPRTTRGRRWRRPTIPATYRAVGAVPGLASVLGWALVARLHLSATLMALVLVAVDRTGSYAHAGVVSAALILGQGIAGPLRGRAVDLRPAARLLVVTSLIYAGGLLVLAALPPAVPWPLFAVAALAVGTVLPPSTQVGRAKVAQCAGSSVRPTAYSLQATGNELVLVVGPALASTAVAILGPTSALVGSSLLVLVGGPGLGRAVRRAGVDAPARAPSTLATADAAHRLVAVPGVVMLVVAMATLVASFAIVDLTLVSWGVERGTPALGGLLVATWAVGSVAGGMVHGSRTSGAPVHLPRRLALVAFWLAPVAFVLPPVGLDAPWVVAALLVAGGAVIPRAVAAVYDRLADLAGDARRAEVFGWLAAATTVATAVAAPAAGLAFERHGPAWAFSLAVLAAAASSLLVVRVPPSP